MAALPHFRKECFPCTNMNMNTITIMHITATRTAMSTPAISR